jgi:hypothetical protein
LIRLAFYLPGPGSAWLKTWDAVRQGDPAVMTEMYLRYKYCGVEFELTVGGVEIISRKRFVTLVDLALSLSSVVKRISTGEDAAFGFTESEEVIHLRQDGNLVVVSSSKRSLQGSVGREELIEEFRKFLREAFSRLIQEVPEFSANPVIRRISPE